MSPDRRGQLKDQRIFRVRGDDPPGWRFKVGIVSRRHPIVLAFVVAVSVLAVPIVMLIGQQGKLRAQDRKLGHQQGTLAHQGSELRRADQRIQGTFDAIQASRVEATRISCKLNEEQNAVLLGLIEFSVRFGKQNPQPGITKEQRSEAITAFQKLLKPIEPEQTRRVCAALVASVRQPDAPKQDLRLPDRR